MITKEQANTLKPRGCVLSNDDYHDAEIAEMGVKLFTAVDKLCRAAGTHTQETVDWLYDGGMLRLFEQYFSGAKQ